MVFFLLRFVYKYPKPEIKDEPTPHVCFTTLMA